MEIQNEIDIARFARASFAVVSLLWNEQRETRSYIDFDAGSGISLDWRIICWDESEKVFHCSRVVDAVPFDRM